MGVYKWGSHQSWQLSQILRLCNSTCQQQYWLWLFFICLFFDSGFYGDQFYLFHLELLNSVSLLNVTRWTKNQLIFAMVVTILLVIILTHLCAYFERFIFFQTSCKGTDFLPSLRILCRMHFVSWGWDKKTINFFFSFGGTFFLNLVNVLLKSQLNIFFSLLHPQIKYCAVILNHNVNNIEKAEKPIISSCINCDRWVDFLH